MLRNREILAPVQRDVTLTLEHSSFFTNKCRSNPSSIESPSPNKIFQIILFRREIRWLYGNAISPEEKCSSLLRITRSRFFPLSPLRFRSADLERFLEAGLFNLSGVRVLCESASRLQHSSSAENPLSSERSAAVRRRDYICRGGQHRRSGWFQAEGFSGRTGGVGCQCRTATAAQPF